VSKKDLDEYAGDLAEYFIILKTYKELTDNDMSTAYQLSKDAIALADRFTEIHFDLRKYEESNKTKEAAMKDLFEKREKRLTKIHDQSRMVWARGKERG
jgi:hypothetical protein